ncbi:hypothetical protein EMCRGX_G024058 [Ephydatia muelleri]
MAIAPALYVPKKSGEVRLCVDYCELNKRTVIDAYPLPLVDEVQDRLAGSAIFSKLDLQSGYWQLPMEPQDREKTAFSPEGYRLSQHTWMMFSFILNEKIHRSHLEEVFQRLQKAGLTLRGSKCQVGLPEVAFLEQVFSGVGVMPDNAKIKTVEEWPTPCNAKEVQQFLGLASYYTRFVSRITKELVDLFTTYGKPEIVHSDKGRNFESAIFQQVLKVFGVKKSQTTAYHPQGDDIVESFNCTLLQLLQTYVTRQEEWDKHLLLALYAHRTAVDFSTAYAPGENGETLHAKLAELTDLVEVHTAEAAEEQRQQCNKHSEERSSKWMIQSGCLYQLLGSGARRRVVHMNRITGMHRFQPAMQLSMEDALTEENQGGSLQWQTPQVDHEIHDVMPTEKRQPRNLPVLVPVGDHVAEDPEEVPRRYPLRVRHRPDYF